MPTAHPAQPDICTLIAEMQGVISAEIQKVQVAVETGRVSKLENDCIDGTERHLVRLRYLVPRIHLLIQVLRNLEEREQFSL